MDDGSFKDRVAKIFGSLAPTSSSNSAWSLSDDAVERRKWRRDEDTSARDETPCSWSFDELLRMNRRRNLRFDDEDDADDDERVRDEWEIRSSVGLDSTLDNEEEEDEFDRVAECRENAGDRLYMADVNERGPYLNLHNVVPNTENFATKDTQADHHAARIRLKEDEAEAFSFPNTDSVTKIKKSYALVSEESDRPKSILKRKDKSADCKPQKRVKFNPGCKIDCGTPSEIDADSHDGSQPLQNASELPDYILNPSKYTHYTFDSSDDYNEECNIKACPDVLSWVKDAKAKKEEPSVVKDSCDLPKSVTYNPKKESW